MTGAEINHDRFVELGLSTDTLTLRLVAAGQAVASHDRSLTILRQLLRKCPLDAMTVETMIATVEDMIMPPLRELPAIDPLVTSGDEPARVLGLLPPTGQDRAAASIEAVETLFNQLVDHVAGSTVAWHHEIAPGALALGLVAMREVMHHGNFHAVRLAADVRMT